MTIAYGIPLTSFIQGAFHIIGSSPIKNKNERKLKNGKESPINDLLPPNSFPKM